MNFEIKKLDLYNIYFEKNVMKKNLINKNDFNLIKRALSFTRPYGVKFIFAIICVLCGIGIGLVQPLVWANLLTRLFTKNYVQIISCLLGLIIIYFSQSGLSFLQSYLFGYLNESIIYDLKNSIYKKILVQYIIS